MVDFRAELAALVAAYDNHRKWTINAVFNELRQAVEHARAVLAQPESASAADGDLLPAKPPNIPSTMAMQYRSAWREGVEDGWNEARAFLARLSRPAVPPASLRQQALRPIPVAERLPGPADFDGLSDCWWYDHDESSWVVCDVVYAQRYGYRHWLPAHALPLPEFE